MTGHDAPSIYLSFLNGGNEMKNMLACTVERIDEEHKKRIVEGDKTYSDLADMVNEYKGYLGDVYTKYKSIIDCSSVVSIMLDNRDYRETIRSFLEIVTNRYVNPFGCSVILFYFDNALDQNTICGFLTIIEEELHTLTGSKYVDFDDGCIEPNHTVFVIDDESYDETFKDLCGTVLLQRPTLVKPNNENRVTIFGYPYILRCPIIVKTEMMTIPATNGYATIRTNEFRVFATPINGSNNFTITVQPMFNEACYGESIPLIMDYKNAKDFYADIVNMITLLYQTEIRQAHKPHTPLNVLSEFMYLGPEYDGIIF